MFSLGHMVETLKNLTISELERRILQGLSFHWEKLTWDLDEDHCNVLKKPLFSLSDMKTHWGKWRTDKNEITISRDLVFNHSWEAVIEVLAHETAHQLACQVLGSADEPPHGPIFQKACFMLRANPKASGSFAPLDQRIAQSSEFETDGIMLRVKKLLALAESKNRHEAESAMKKAHLLIAKYNISAYDNKRPRNYVTVFVGKPALRHMRDKYVLANLLIDFYFVQGIWSPCYVIEKGKRGRVLEISGTPANVNFAAYVHDVIQAFIDRQWQQYTQNKRLTHHRKTDFAVGIIQGFEKTLKKGVNSLENKCNGTRAIVLRQDPQLDSYISYLYPKIRSVSRAAMYIDREILNDGQKIGKRLIISKGIHHHGNGEKYLIR